MMQEPVYQSDKCCVPEEPRAERPMDKNTMSELAGFRAQGELSSSLI